MSIPENSKAVGCNTRENSIGLGIAQKEWIAPIPGTTKIHRLQENIGASTVKLTTENLQQIEEAVSQITIQGHRYPKSSQKMVDE